MMNHVNITIPDSEVNKICLPAINPKQIVTNVVPKPGFDLCTALEEVYPIPDLICSYLNYNDLTSMAKISQIWQNSAIREKQKRSQLSWMCFNAHQIAHSEKFHWMKKDNALIFYSYPLIRLSKYICTHEEKAERMPMIEFIEKMLLTEEGDDNDYACISVREITNVKISRNNLDLPTYYCLGVMLPTIPNLRIEKFYYSLNKQSSINDILGPEDNMSTVIIFGISNPKKVLNKLVTELHERQQESFGIGGGLVWGIKSNKNQSERLIKANNLYCVGFIENAKEKSNFFSATAVLKDGDPLEHKLKEFHSAVEYREQSLLFSFCCIEKDTRESNEYSLIRSYFPDIVLVPIRVNGEIGFDHNWRHIEEPPQKQCRKNVERCHEYTTVLVYLSWGKINDTKKK